MNTFLTRIQKYFPLLKGIFIYAWLVNLQQTDSYYGVYVLLAVYSLFPMVRNPAVPDSKHKKACAIFALPFSAAVLLANYSLFSPWSGLMNLFDAACTLLGGEIVFYQILISMTEGLPLSVNAQKRTRPFLVFWGCFSLISAVYLCYLFLCSYPGLLSRDAFSTVRQILTGDYNNTMPFWHTMTVELFYRIGYGVFGEINAAIAVYMVAQILFLAACFSYALMTLYQVGVPVPILAAVLGGYTILPFHVVYSITLWKDVLFGAAALLVITAMYRALRGIGKKQVWNEAVLVLGAIGLSLWRTNGWYAMVITTVVLAVFMGRKRKRMLCLLAGVLVFCWVLINPVLSLLGVPETDYVEALAVPFQQIGRVVATDCPLTQQESDQLSQIFDLELIKEKYDPQTVDPIKFEAFFHADILRENLIDYAKLWIRLGLRYPGTYLQAWVEETKGFWNGGYDYWIYMHHQERNDLGILDSSGQNPVANLFRAVFRYLEYPGILKPVYSIGLHIWIVLICCFLCVRKKREEYILTVPILVIIAGLWIGTPVFAEFRYAYPVFASIPVILCATIFEPEPKDTI